MRMRTHRLICANMGSTSSHPWIRHLTIRAAESTCARVPIVMIAMPLLPPVACYLTVCQAFRDGGLRGEPCRHCCVFQYMLVWENDWLQPATMAVTPPPLPSPHFATTVPTINSPPCPSPLKHWALTHNHWAATKHAITLEVLFAFLPYQPSLPIKQSSSFVSSPSSSSSQSLPSLRRGVVLGLWIKCRNEKIVCVYALVHSERQHTNPEKKKWSRVLSSTNGDQTLLRMMHKHKLLWLLAALRLSDLSINMMWVVISHCLTRTG